jgi:hypothetical protein
MAQLALAQIVLCGLNVSISFDKGRGILVEFGKF